MARAHRIGTLSSTMGLKKFEHHLLLLDRCKAGSKAAFTFLDQI
jgi:hypothetical protein